MYIYYTFLLILIILYIFTDSKNNKAKNMDINKYDEFR